MHNEGLINYKVIISKFERDFKPQTSDWLADAKEWIGEGIAKIGVAAQRQRVTLKLNVKEGMLRMPCTADNFIAIIYQGLRLAKNPRVQRSKEISKLSSIPHPHHYYNFNGQYLTFTFTEGEIEFLYNGLPMDCDDFLIIDNAYYHESLCFYILTRMLMGGYTHNIFNYPVAEAKFEHFAQKARNEIDELKISDMDAFIQEWCSPFSGVDVVNRSFGNVQYHHGLIGNNNNTDNPFTI